MMFNSTRHNDLRRAVLVISQDHVILKPVVISVAHAMTRFVISAALIIIIVISKELVISAARIITEAIGITVAALVI
ncbi:hypothetical protein DPMN_096500 [Dreissena polymorpha]|uniref:Uncharacterized protein n=1 Tax=Dreissena polymorpha TaxID=45954 RepID=A0A9D4LB74_DREPO|nr:hypothetical protein DPMN_096500 [Dreissena polymorpha]